MNIKEIVTTITEGVKGLTGIFGGLIILSILTEVLFGSGTFGINVVENITTLATYFLDSGFAGVITLFVLLSLWK